MDESKLSDDQKEYLEQMLNSSDRLRKMISSVLDINAIEQGVSNLQPEKTDVGECLDYIQKSFFGLAKAKNISLIKEYELNKYFILVDRNYLIQVLENLVSNAIKYSEPNTDVHLTATSGDGRVQISVKDNGPGIDADDQKKLFTAFHKLSAKPTGGEESTGLGLSIAKRYVDLMNGIINCTSEPGKGSTFSVEFEEVD